MARLTLLWSLAFGLMTNAVADPMPATSPTATASRKPGEPAAQLVGKVAALNAKDLEKLTFRELHYLRAAVIASGGYKFPEDRPRLTLYFHPIETSNLPVCRKGDVRGNCKVVPVCDRGCKILDLGNSDFPVVKDNTDYRLSPEHPVAFANIRQALIAKIRKLKRPQELPAVVARENGAFAKVSLVTSSTDRREVDAVSLFGRVAYEGTRATEILLQDLMGTLSLVGLIDAFKEDRYTFDPSELLGLSLGDLDLLRKVLLARAGKTFADPLQRELAALRVRANGSDGQLSSAAQGAMDLLNEIIKRHTQGELSDLPKSIRSKTSDADEASLSYLFAM